MKAKALDCGIALEKLSRIEKPVKKNQRSRHNQWSFYQLKSFIQYKALLQGIPVELVDCRNTSRTCSKCGCIDKKNRSTRDDFKCTSCGFTAYADHNAAINIAARAYVNKPIVASDLIKQVA